MGCARCDALARELAEAREELRAWEDYDRDNGRVDADEDRLARWRQAYRGLSIGGVLALMALADRPDRIVSRDGVLRASRRGSVKPVEECQARLAAVLICKARASLRVRAQDGRLPDVFGTRTGGIDLTWGAGWTLSSRNAAAVRALAGEA
ncbi:hypothetical protein SH203_02857 [Brevundimonas sp. SH203]|nr:hypothetical protein SH203_02857 [Brevundimonas sp. SH203]